MRQLKFIVFVILTVSACTDQEFSNNIENESDKYCNNEPEAIVEHLLSTNSEEYLSSFIENEEIIFVNNEDINDTLRWNKTKQKLDLLNRYFYDIPCEEDASMLKEVYAEKRFSFIEYEDEKNDQTIKIGVSGLIEIVDGIPVKVLGEILEVKRSPNNRTSAYHIIDYFITQDVPYDDYSCTPGSKFYKEIEVQELTLNNVLTMDVPGENDYFKVYFNREKGIIMMEEITAGIFWRNASFVKG